MNESVKRTSRWASKYYTHDRSHYPVPQSAVPLSAVAMMAPLPSEGITPGMEEQMKEWLDSYRSVRHRTARSETTKDKAGGLPPAVYAVQPTANESEERLRFPEEIESNHSIEFRTTTSCQYTICGWWGCFWDVRGSQRGTNWWIWDRFWWQRHRKWRTSITRSGRAVRAFVRLDLWQ